MNLTLAPLLLVALLAQAVVPAQPDATPSPERVLGLIRAAFRAQRPPPPYVSYTFARKQNTDQGYPDVVNSYTYRIWARTSDRAALGRRVFRDDYAYGPEFMRPAFNEDRDPGPPTADLFEPAPARPRPVSEVPTPVPEPAGGSPLVIGRVETFVESDYRVTRLAYEGDLVHLVLEPIREPARNRLREIYADAASYELRKVVAADRLFVEKDKAYGATFTILLGRVAGHLVVTDIHGHVGDGYAGDGVDVDMTFRDIRFPATLPAWYFDPRQYGPHANEAPH